MAVDVVHRLQPVYIAKGGDEPAVALAASTLDLIVQLFKPDASSPGAGEIVGPRAFAVVSGIAAVIAGVPPVFPGVFAVVLRVLTVFPGVFAVVLRVLTVTACARAITHRVPAIARRLDPVLTRPLPVARCTTSARLTAAAQLFDPKCVPVGQLVAIVELVGLKVMSLGAPVAQRR